VNTLTKLALGMIGHPKLRAFESGSADDIVLPPPEMTGGLGILDAMKGRHSQRAFSSATLELDLLGNLLWAGCGINRAQEGGRTAPSAMNAQEVDLYLAQAKGLYFYDARRHVLKLVVAKDVRKVTGYQDFVDEAPLDLVYVANHSRMSLIPASKRITYSAVAVGAITQNVALFCVSAGLASVVRAWFDRQVLAREMGLEPDQTIVLSQTVGHPKAA
jgi:SagB-type dehydrogenase family enzyme